MHSFNPRIDKTLCFALSYYPDPILVRRSHPIVEYDAVPRIADGLFDTMTFHGGIGIAACQCKLNIRMIALRVQGMRKAFINPEIVERSPSMVEIEETCLSVPGLAIVQKRHETVVVKAHDISGMQFFMELKDRQSVLAQHEIDHLNGITIASGLSFLKRKLLGRKIGKLITAINDKTAVW